MASKSLITWGAGILLASTLGCKNDPQQASCPDPKQLACTFPQGLLCTDVQVDNNNCGQCGTVCPSDRTCQNGLCQLPGSTNNSSYGGSSANSGNSSNKGGSTSSSNKTNGGQGGEDNNSSSTSENGGSGDGGSDDGGSTSTSSSSGNKGGSSSSSSTGNKGGSTSTSSSSGNKGGTSSSSSTGNKGGTSSSSQGGTSNSSSTSTPKGGTTSTTSTTPTGDEPPGWWTSWKDEGWHGCAWTAIGSESTSGTKIDPEDFGSKAAGDPYNVWGKVVKHEEYLSVSLIGFNLNEDPAGADCGRKAEATEGPPGVTFDSSYKGIAVNVAKGGSHESDTSFTLRVQIQTPKGNLSGAAGENDRWCQTITVAAGKAFMPFSDFYTKCWNVGSDDPAENPVGNTYAGEAISAIVFTVPGGKDADIPFEFTINGFALGNIAEDAPDGGATTTFSGTIGGPGGKDLDYERAKIVVDGEEYIIQNNNWGNWEGTDQTITYKNNSFKITGTTGSGPGGGVPASFPSIYIGHNGSTLNGMSTSATDNLPKVVSSITKIDTTFNWSGSCGSGFNASYDVWFSQSKPTSEYQDAISGFVMVWLCDPSDAQPIGSSTGTVSIENHTWDRWVGNRGGSGSNSNAPVVSYVAQPAFNSFTFDLKKFITDAQSHGISSSWYLTDVFAGFEIWNGGATNGLAVTEFTCKVQ